MLASTERSVAIERQRRSQLHRVNHVRDGGPVLTGCIVDAFTKYSSPRSSQQFPNARSSAATNAVLTQNVGQSTTAGFTDTHQLIGVVDSHDCLNTASGNAPSSDNRKSKSGNKPASCVRIIRHKSMISDSSDTSAATKVVLDEVTEGRSAPLDTECQNSAKKLTSDHGSQARPIDGHSAVVKLHCSSLKEQPGSATFSQSPSARADRRTSSQRRVVGGRRTSRLDRHVYQCYFAGILHSSRRSERFVRLQQLYAMLEKVVSMETEMSLRHQITPSVTDRRRCQLSRSNLATYNCNQEHWRQRLLELRKLYAKLDAAQDDKEFFYDNGHLDAFQWKSWSDLGLNKKSTSLSTLKDLFEAAVVSSSPEITTASQLQHVEHGLSYAKLLEMFQHLDKRTRQKSWLQRKSSRQRSVTNVRKLDGTYIKMMESAAKNAKALTLHGYHMNEHRNRYDAYVQSRRIYRPKSSQSIFEQLSSDDQLETDEVASSDRTMSTASLCANTCYCSERSDELIAKPASESTDSLLIPSPATSAGSVPNCSSSAHQANTCDEGRSRYQSETQSGQPIVSVEVATDVKQSSPEIVYCDEKSTQQQVTSNDDQGIRVDELDAVAPKLGSRWKQKSRKRERQRPRRRTRNITVDQRIDTLGAVSGNTGRHHIDAWRRSSRPLSGGVNQALAYFNSLCIDASNNSNDNASVCENISVISSSESHDRPTREQIVHAKISNQMTPAIQASTENNELPYTCSQAVDCEMKFSTEIKLDVNIDASVTVPDQRKVVLPQLYSCRDEAVAADFPASSVTGHSQMMRSRAVNIDKRLSQYKVDTTKSNEYRRKSANAKKTDAEAAGVQSDVTTTREVRPTYVRCAPVVRMLSESQPIQTTSVSSPVFIDCRQAIVRKLPSMIDQQSANKQPFTTSSVSNPAPCTGTVSTGQSTDSDRSCRDDEVKQTVEKNLHSKMGASKVTATTDVDGCSVPKDLPCVKTNVMYMSAIDSSSFICRLCCRSSASCNCAATAETNTRSGSEHRPDNMSANDFMSAASYSACDLHQRPVTVTDDPSYGELRSTIGNRRGLGRQDLEMRRMMDSLDTIGSEWTSGRPRRLTEPFHLTSDMNNNNNNNSQTRQWKSGNINDEQSSLSRLNLNDKQVSVTAAATNNSNQGDPACRPTARMLNGDASGNKRESFDNCSNTSSVHGRTDHDTTMYNSAPQLNVTGSSANGQNNVVRRVCALYNYSPRHADELQLNKGDIIYVVDICDDGWFFGTSERTKQFGTFPGNYVRPVTCQRRAVKLID